MPVKRKIEDLKPTKLEDYLAEIGEDNNPEILAPRLFEAINNYIYDRDFIRNTKFHGSGGLDDLENYFVPDFNQLLKATYDKVSIMVKDLEANYKLGNDKNSVFLKEFMYDPIEALKKQSDLLGPILDRLARYQATGELKNEEDYAKLSSFNQTFKNEITNAKEDYDDFIRNDKHEWREKQRLRSGWFINYFNKGKGDFTEILKSNKGGFFENLFGTTSKEYKELARRLTTVQEEGPEKGDLSGLREAAIAYMKHKFKDSFSIDGDSYIFSGDAFDKLDSTSKARVRLCQQILDSVKQAEHDSENGYNPAAYVPANENDVDIAAIEEAIFVGMQASKVKTNPENNILNNDIIKVNNKISFQDEIKNDVDDKMISNIIVNENDNNNIIKNEIEDIKND
jgi:hypothetical protein